jgi:hypothetical protein
MSSALRVHRLIESLIEGDEDLFQQGLNQELSLRKEDFCKFLSIKIFESMQEKIVEKEINLTEEVKEFISLLEQFKDKKTLKIQFKNKSIINISENEISPVKQLFDNLNSENQKLLARNLFESPQHFKQATEFAKKVKGLFT